MSSNGSHKDAGGTELSDDFTYYAKNPASPGTTSMTFTMDPSVTMPDGSSCTWEVDGSPLADGTDGTLSKTLGELVALTGSTSYPVTFTLGCTVDKPGYESASSSETITIDRRLPGFYVKLTAYPGATGELSGARNRALNSSTVNDNTEFTLTINSGEAVEFPSSGSVGFDLYDHTTGTLLKHFSFASVPNPFTFTMTPQEMLSKLGKTLDDLNGWRALSGENLILANALVLDFEVKNLTYDGLTLDSTDNNLFDRMLLYKLTF
jgi:hypothetical protein